jgi:hypothetical protein
MEYLHYTAFPINTFIDGVKQRNWMKPSGLWLSEGSQWQDWCDAEGFATCNMNTCYIYSASICKDKLFVISSLDDLNTLHEKYEIKNKVHLHGGIDWKEVTKDYDGICFENYQEVKRDYFMNSNNFAQMWFLGVDISCACIWNPSSVITDWCINREGLPKDKLYQKTIIDREYTPQETEIAV